MMNQLKFIANCADCKDKLIGFDFRKFVTFKVIKQAKSKRFFLCYKLAPCSQTTYEKIMNVTDRNCNFVVEDCLALNCLFFQIKETHDES